MHRFVKLDSDDDDDEEELTSKMEWMMVESKVDGTRYAMGPPTNPNHRYVNRKIQTREEKPVPVWCKITQSLSTKRKMADKSEGVQTIYYKNAKYVIIIPSNL